MSNSKSDLNEYYQKRKQKLPTYETIKVGGCDHKPMFRSIVSTFDNISVKSDTFNNKKDAEKNAAMKMLILINNIHDNDDDLLDDIKDDIKDDDKNDDKYHKQKYKVYIDMENLPQAHKEIEKFNCEIIGYVSRRSPIVEKMNEYNFRIVIANSIAKDAADIFMCMDIVKDNVCCDPGDLDEYMNSKIIIILTKDHFGQTAVEWLNQNNIKSYYCVNTLELKEIIV